MGTSEQRINGTANGKISLSHRRRGMGYVYFLSMTMLLAVISLSALMFTRIQRRSVEGNEDTMAARFYAQSALELGFAKIHLDPNWRTTLGSGAWVTKQPIGGGTLSIDVLIIDDGDGNPNNDSVELVGTGVYGLATQKIEITLYDLSSNGGLVTAVGSGRRKAG